MGRWVKIVIMPCGEFLGRKWNLQDLVIASTLSPMHFLYLHPVILLGTFWVAFALHMLTSLGVTLSFHRNLSHKSFRLPKWLKYLFAYVAVLSLQGSPIDWVSSHRHHHHSRFFYGELKNVQDLERQAFYREISVWVRTSDLEIVCQNLGFLQQCKCRRASNGGSKV
ncbi:palmitoyl-monogalactosyldiacylglycerol delta-7 desaturase [Pyrus ussuriensis x Pyrus communis]|uniref:Palmitoyl-monogalactosyldiacylglycerol delta-7 desaturase n=1 Tax=Pyrus ussuriensis x Pyrus communis TaxID=2448454 RepID=A0A5N5FYM0_9ROSA|nr:palmitoyl-monogalactosyldiacylglycerol delta-7 desaturase [Pyrus ussuriensis x Pyrus communis]